MFICFLRCLSFWIKISVQAVAAVAAVLRLMCRHLCVSLRRHLAPPYTTGITAGAVRHFIKSKGVGCVGTVVRFRGSNKLVHAPHIEHGWFNSQDIAAMHVSKL